MTEQQMRTIEAAIDEAIEALPNGNDRQLTDWVVTHRFPSFSKEIHDALFDEGLKAAICERARLMGVTLQE